MFEIIIYFDFFGKKIWNDNVYKFFVYFFFIKLFFTLYLYTTNYCRLLKNFSSNSLLHKEMLAILAALTEVIQANGGKETSTEYFAALVSGSFIILYYLLKLIIFNQFTFRLLHCKQH